MKEEVRVLRTEAACTAADEAAYRAMDADGKAKLEKKTRSFLSEYSTSYDHREALLCIGELECPAYHWTVARRYVDKPDCGYFLFIYYYFVRILLTI